MIALLFLSGPAQANDGMDAELSSLYERARQESAAFRAIEMQRAWVRGETNDGGDRSDAVQDLALARKILTPQELADVQPGAGGELVPPAMTAEAPPLVRVRGAGRQGGLSLSAEKQKVRQRIQNFKERQAASTRLLRKELARANESRGKVAENQPYIDAAFRKLLGIKNQRMHEVRLIRATHQRPDGGSRTFQGRSPNTLRTNLRALYLQVQSIENEIRFYGLEPKLIAGWRNIATRVRNVVAGLKKASRLNKAVASSQRTTGKRRSKRKGLTKAQKKLRRKSGLAQRKLLRKKGVKGPHKRSKKSRR